MLKILFAVVLMTVSPILHAQSVRRTVVINLPGDVKLEMVEIPAGKFMMGSRDGERGHNYYRESQDNMQENPVHEVSFAKPFYMGMYEVTQKQWLAVMGKFNDQPGGSSAATARSPAATPQYGLGDDYPIYFATHQEGQAFAAALNAHIEKTGQPKLKFRLPTESEWEYACRAGTTTRFFFGDSLVGDGDGGDGMIDGPTGSDAFPGLRSDYMWFGIRGGKGAEEGELGVKPVGQKEPSAWGLHDMAGNVWEWCEDTRQTDYSQAPTDGKPQTIESSKRVLRGGGWLNTARVCRSAFREYNAPGIRRLDYGLRIAADGE
jgi:formylglycine-generating enzyme required for sulfatase activity